MLQKMRHWPKSPDVDKFMPLVVKAIYIISYAILMDFKIF